MEKYKPVLKRAARYMDRALEEYAVLTTFSLGSKDFENICYRSQELLHELFEEATRPRDLEANEQNGTRGLVMGLQKLIRDAKKLPEGKKAVIEHHKEVMRHVKSVRKMLRDVYTP